MFVALLGIGSDEDCSLRHWVGAGVVLVFSATWLVAVMIRVASISFIFLFAAVALKAVVKVYFGSGSSDESEYALVQIDERAVALTKPCRKHILFLFIIFLLWF